MGSRDFIGWNALLNVSSYLSMKKGEKTVFNIE